MNPQQETLLRAFRIGYEDLSVNRLGRLSAAQQRKLLSNANRSLILTSLFSFFMTTTFYIGHKTVTDPVHWIVGILLFVVLFVFSLIISIKNIHQTRAAVASGQVESLLG